MLFHHRLGLAYTDLQDRIIAIRLERRRSYGSELQFWKEFIRIRPTVLGAIFATLSQAMTYLPAIERSHTALSRFADFEYWDLAIAEVFDKAGLGYTQEDFRRAYADNIQNVRFHVLEGHPIAECLVWLRDHPERHTAKGKWKGTPGQLLESLEAISDINVDKAQKSWPKTPNWLMRRLVDIKSELEEAGISYSERPERTPSGKVRRIITLAFSPR